MREIKGEAITQAVARLCMSANRNLPQDVRTCITQSQERESWEPARGILSKIVENYKIAEEDQLPICQGHRRRLRLPRSRPRGPHPGRPGTSGQCRRPPRLSGSRPPVLRGGGPPAPGKHQGQHPRRPVHPSVPGDRLKITVAPKGRR